MGAEMSMSWGQALPTPLLQSWIRMEILHGTHFLAAAPRMKAMGSRWIRPGMSMWWASARRPGVRLFARLAAALTPLLRSWIRAEISLGTRFLEAAVMIMAMESQSMGAGMYMWWASAMSLGVRPSAPSALALITLIFATTPLLRSWIRAEISAGIRFLETAGTILMDRWQWQ